MSDEEIVKKCNDLARTFYQAYGYEAPEDFKFYNSRHPQELSMWELAVIAYDHIAQTDVAEILRYLE